MYRGIGTRDTPVSGEITVERDRYRAADMPMPPERFAELLRQRRERPPGELWHHVPSREPAAESSNLAAELLEEARLRSLESGELLLVSEEASLVDLEAAAAAIPTASAMPSTVDADPMTISLAEPRLLCPRMFALAGWVPSLSEHLRMLEGALRGGLAVGQAMLVGHVETLPERVEHLVRLRELRDGAQATGLGGMLMVAVHLAALERMPGTSEMALAAAAAACPADPETDRRHAQAIARLALGPGAVVAL